MLRWFMPVFQAGVVCPSCKSAGAQLLDMSSDSLVNFYRCPECAHVWTMTKDNVIILRHVTSLAKSARHARTH